MHTIKRKDIQGICPGTAHSQGYFTWIRRSGETEEVDDKILQIDAFDEVFIVVSEGTVSTKEDGQFSSTTPVKHCRTPEEAIALVNKLNGVLGTRDLSLPYAQCTDCQSDKLEQSSTHWERGLLTFHCLECGREFRLNRNND
jgi:hypothetical protein